MVEANSSDVKVTKFIVMKAMILFSRSVYDCSK